LSSLIPAFSPVEKEKIEDGLRREIMVPEKLSALRLKYIFYFN
jgi:hypothetical protein